MLTMPDPSKLNTLREAILRSELKALTEETVLMNKYRDYFDGEQKLVYSTEIFREVFGEAFEGFKDNWCEVVVNATNSRLEITGFNFKDDDDFATANKIWDVMLLNEIDEQQKDLHEGVLVEGRAFAIVWPDNELGAVVDWQPGQLCRIFYDPDRRTKALWAVKRWTVETGEVYVTFYTPEAVFKFVDGGNSLSPSSGRPSSSSALTEIPGVGFFGSLQKREIEGEAWPLPNPFDRVPVIEFNNTSYRSEIKGTIPQQDALNKTLLDMMVTSEFQAMHQRVVETMSSAPEGGWRSGPGEVWHFKPSFDSDGNHIPAQFKTFETSNPTTYMQPISMWLQHMALTSSTPVRYFMQSDRGGRGDSPSGDSLLVDDKPLNDKVEDKQKRLGNRWIEVARLVAQALKIDSSSTLLGETVWKDPRHDYRLSTYAEGQALITIGVPIEFVVTKLGFTPEEMKVVLEMVEKAKVEAEAKEQRQLDAQAVNQAADTAPSANVDSP